MRKETRSRSSETGAVAIIVAVSLAVLVGFAGLVLDLGRLYINKTELQSAADACALAAAPYLNCDPNVAGSCPADNSNLKKAANAGIFAAGKNRKDFQDDVVSIDGSDVRFSTALAPNSAYLTAGAANSASKYVMCIARSQGIIPWFMGVLGLSEGNDVNALAVATLGPGQEFCSSAPMGICANALTPPYGYSEGDWITLNVHTYNNEDDIDVDELQQPKSFRWIDFDPNAGGSDEVRDRLAGKNTVCGLKNGDNVREMGAKQGVKSAYNTRFGLYKNASGNEKQYSPENAPPDYTGYAYPTNDKADPIVLEGQDAYGPYLNRRLSNSPFDDKEYYDEDGKAWGKPASEDDYKNFGADKRLIGVPMIACPGPGKDTPILYMACVLMLNPMNTGAAAKEQKLFLQYLGLAKDSTVAKCQTMGPPGGNGLDVPMLVQ